jgi:hypothetical protein
MPQTGEMPMPKYKAARWFNSRARLSVDFEAPDDDAAIEYATSLARSDWIAKGHYMQDNDDDDLDGDALIDLHGFEEDTSPAEPLLCGEHVEEALPYTWDATEFARWCASIPHTSKTPNDFQHPQTAKALLDKITDKARLICGKTD